MELGDRVVFVARPFLFCLWLSLDKNFTGGEFIVIHLIPRLNRINTSINDHRFLLSFLPVPRPLSVDYILLIVIKLPQISLSHSFFFPLHFHIWTRTILRIAATRWKITKKVDGRRNHGYRFDGVEKSENIARLDSCRRRVEGTGENGEAADSTEPRDERIREAAASTRVSRTPVRQCSRPSSLHLEEGRSCPKVVPPGRGEGGTPRPPSSNKMEVFSSFQLRLPWSTHVVSPLLWSTSHCPTTKPSLSLCLSLSSLSLVRIFRLASIEDGEPRDRSIFFVKFDDERWGSRFS